MSINALDTHRAVKALREVGFDENQAEIMVDTVNKSINENVVTKTDLEVDRRDVQAEAKTEFDKVKDEIRGVQASSKTEFDKVKDEIRDVRDEIKDVRTEIKDVRAESKAEFDKVRAEIKDLKVRMEQFETRIENKMEAREQRIINRLGGLMIALTGLVVAAVKIL